MYVFGLTRICVCMVLKVFRHTMICVCFVCIWACQDMCLYVLRRARICVCLYVFGLIRIYVCMYSGVPGYVFVCIWVYQDMCLCVFVRSCIFSTEIEVGIRKYPTELYIRTKPFPPATDSYTDSHPRYTFDATWHYASPPLNQTQ